MTLRRFGCLVGLTIICANCVVFADDPTRCAQEALRRRNFYFGNIDGRMTPELGNSIKRYQARKNLEVTGEIDQETAESLDIRVTGRSSSRARPWPDLPILKSDTALEKVEEAAVAAREPVQLVVQTSESPAAPAPPAEPPAPVSASASDSVAKLVADYLRDAETNDVDSQLRYYGQPVEYFDHGARGAEFIKRDTLNYVKRWPNRHYELVSPVASSAGVDNEVQAEFTIAFTVKNEKTSVSGRTRNFWTLKPENSGTFRIIAIREQRVRE